MTFEQIIKELNERKYHPVYFLQGEEPYFIDYISNCIEHEVLNEDEKSFDLTVVYGCDINRDTIVGLAKSSPMFSKYRVVIIKEAQNIKNFVGAKNSENGENALEKYLENPVHSTILVFCYKYKKIDARTGFSKLLNKNAIVFDSSKVSEYKLSSWISDYIKGEGYSINAASAALLAEYLGNDLSKIVNEVKKLFIELPLGSDITNEIIEQNIGISKDYNIFELQKAIGNRNMLQINRIINYFDSNPKENPIQMAIPMLYKFFIKVLIYHRLPIKSNAANVLGVSPYYLKDYTESARYFSQQQLIKIIHILRDYDMRSKGFGATSNLSSGDIYKEMIFKILN
jgi:DNA polymerase-3 subunit delta